jgi:hypothetical protein
MSEFQIKPAVRTGIKPLIGLYGKSGGGKTRTALLIARGIVGPKGRITLIDTERGRGSIFADKIPGGYNVLDLEEPFSPARYEDAFKVAEENSDIIAIDTLSHCWSGPGGVLEMQEAELYRMAKDDYQRREACKMAAWIEPKKQLKSLIQGTILRTRLPLICNLRGEEKTHIIKKDGEKTKVVTDQWTTPIFDSRFIFEMLICAEVYQKEGKGGFLHITKITHEDLFACLPGEDEQASIKHGELLAKWSLGGAAATTATQTTTPPKSHLRVLKSKLWALMAHVHQCQAGDSKDLMQLGKDRLTQHLIDETFISDTESLDELTEDRLAEVIAKIEAKQTENQ